MTGRVDFYVLDREDSRQRMVVGCRLAEKAYLRDLRAVLLADTTGDAEALDALLWTFADPSFVPHGLIVNGAAADPSAPVQLTADAARAPAADVLVNLSARMPEGFERYPRIAEIVDAEPGRRERARERFKTYRDHALVVETHRLHDGDEP
ncbi:MAG: DNA polymerase III subunit chi [Gammaproteobacteria bacterium]|nr:DNA polymerase III subunit chi [Gammaproteobacteria bacterium]